MGECVGVLVGELGGNSFSWFPRDGFPHSEVGGALGGEEGYVHALLGGRAGDAVIHADDNYY